MNKMIVRAGATLAMCLFVIPAFARPDGDDKKPKGVTCPACKMVMADKKSDKTPVAVQMKKGAKVVYCCAHCKMDPKIVVKTKAKSDTKM